MRKPLFRGGDVAAWPLTEEQAACVTVYPIAQDRTDDGILALQWNLTPEHARRLLSDLQQACDAIDAQAAELAKEGA